MYNFQIIIVPLYSKPINVKTWKLSLVSTESLIIQKQLVQMFIDVYQHFQKQ